MSARHVEESLIMSEDDNPGRPNDRLLHLAKAAFFTAITVWRDSPIFEGRTGGGMEYAPMTWPGEHYCLLPSLIDVIRWGKDSTVPVGVSVVEIGTSSGQSAVAMLAALDHRDDRLVTFDVMPWRNCNPVLKEEDFKDGRLIQIVADMTNPNHFAGFKEHIEGADFIFIDAAKDGICEPKLIHHLNQCNFKNPPIILFDDIRVANMLWIWRGIDKPKMDITSISHWSGSGLVEWVNK